MDHIQFTLDKIASVPESCILVIGANFALPQISEGNSVIVQNDPEKDIINWADDYMNEREYTPFDMIIMLRVFEHLPVRLIDYYIVKLGELLREDGQLVIVVPNMAEAYQKITELFNNRGIDGFRFMRLNFEIFNEGPSSWDCHKTWTDMNTVPYLLEREGIFKVETQQIIPSLCPGEPKINEILVIAIRR